MEDCAWCFALSMNLFTQEGYKCKKARYRQVPADIRKIVATRALTRFEASLVALEMHCVKARALPHIKVMTFGADSDSREKTTPPPARW